MPRGTRGPGGGPKRRIRTRLMTIDTRSVIILRNRSKKPIPANWRELLVQVVDKVCLQPPRHFFGPGLEPRPIERPLATITNGSLPTGSVLFTLNQREDRTRLQKRVIDWALSRCDVNLWPVPKPTSHVGKGGERFVNSGLLLRDTLVGDNRHSFNPFRLQDVSGVNWRHVVQYTARKGRAEYLGIKTTCGGPCECRRTLPELWPLGWEMHT